ncbi:hypothetical protein FANTH_8244 [Fusarium anthophilum]|uniref:FAD-binding domain-containing protein n=1 Tax=Fusarium anthophilum TaxID=48485 RepID=A0A8H4ZC03_9HYPO|nr:hypothetical protein FANTH_8244 [Fusarium anthophilum]
MPSHAEIAAFPEPDAAFAKMLEDSPKPPPLSANVDISALRQHTNAEKAKFREGLGDAGPGLTERDIKIPLDRRELDAYVYAPLGKFPAGSLPVYLFFHGGGFCIGSRFDDMEANRRLALEANIVVVSLEYSLAPEHPFPQAVYDGLDTLKWITRNTNAVHPSASVSRGLIIGGTSAGGNIANAVVYLNRDQDDSVQVTGQFLSVPPLLPLPVVPEKYREYYLSFEQNHSITVLPPDLVGKFMELLQSEPVVTDRLKAKISTTVAIVGAGPVGLFTALLLAQAGIKVTVFETGSRLNQSPRAVAYFPAVLEEFKKAGILQDVIDKGEKNADGCAWREPSGKVLAAVDPPPDSPQFAVCLSQPEFGEIVLKRLLETGNAEVVFNHTYRRHQQRESSVLLWIKSPSQETEVVCECQYLIGADGGRSEVRKALGVELKGFTWESLQLVAVNFQYPLSDLGWKQANFIVDGVSWGVIVKRGKGNSWRFATGTQAPDIVNGTLDDATVKVVKDRLMRLLPGDTSQIGWEAMAPYKVHQRCATTFRKGNVLLAGDAAHLNSPIGGLGLTTGLLDAAHLAKSLRQTLLDKAEPIVLDQYAEIRRSIFLHRTNPLSTDNFNRLRSQDPEHVRQRDEFFAKLNKSKDIATVLQVGLPDYALSSTSETSFSTYEEVTWFITVTKLDDWSDERFTHEYKVVHANMTRHGKEQGAPTRHYTQYKNLYQKVPGTKQAGCAYVTCLVFPNLFLVHAGLQDPGYRATAGAHSFCRLDQQGCLTRKISEFSKGGNGSSKSIIRALLFHERCSETDECSEDWVQERAAKFSTTVKSDDRAYGYALWQDMTPKNSKTLFRDSQFESGRWHNFKAVEAFDFLDTASANTFLREHMEHITEGGKQTTTAVVSDPDLIF